MDGEHFTLSFDVLDRNSARAFAASTPSVFPPKWISSIAVGSTASRRGAISARVSSFRPRPCNENTEDILVYGPNSSNSEDEGMRERASRNESK